MNQRDTKARLAVKARLAGAVHEMNEALDQARRDGYQVAFSEVDVTTTKDPVSRSWVYVHIWRETDHEEFS